VYERDRWYVEPFVDERTLTVRLLPVLKRDALRKLYDQREEIARIVADDIEAIRMGEVRPVEEVATDTGKLDIPDLADTVKEIPDDQSETDPRRKVAALLEAGKLHLRAGQLDLAEEAFKGALVIDPLNAAAKDYLARVRQTRQLQKERQEMIELIEQLLELEKGGESDSEE
jgi:tetratricopeptide (TPR) repeat protein